jgi:hypothetical protein
LWTKLRVPDLRSSRGAPREVELGWADIDAGRVSIAADDISAADRMIDGLYALISRLLEFPSMQAHASPADRRGH